MDLDLMNLVVDVYNYDLTNESRIGLAEHVVQWRVDQSLFTYFFTFRTYKTTL